VFEVSVGFGLNGVFDFLPHFIEKTALPHELGGSLILLRIEGGSQLAV